MLHGYKAGSNIKREIPSDANVLAGFEIAEILHLPNLQRFFAFPDIWVFVFFKIPE